MNKKEQLKQAIQQHSFIKSDKAYITSKKGTKSNWIMDLRGLMMNGASINAISDLFWEQMEQYLPFQVGGEELSAVFLVTAIVQKGHQLGHDVSGFIARKERKHYGLSKRIEGVIKKDIPVVLVDDVTNAAGAFKKAFDITQLEGGNVEHFFTIIDYNNPNGHKKIEKEGVQKHTIFTLEDFDLELMKLKKDNNILGVTKFSYISTLNLPNPDFFHTKPRTAFIKHNNKHFFISENGSLFSFNIEKKERNCIFDSKAFISPKVPQFIQHENILILCPDGTTIYAFDLKTESIIWKHRNYSTIYQFKIIENFLVLAEEQENKKHYLNSLNLESGEVIEQQERASKIELHIVNTQLFALQDQGIYELHPSTLQLTQMFTHDAKTADFIASSLHIITQQNDTDVIVHKENTVQSLYSGPLLHYAEIFGELLVLWNNTKTLAIKNISENKVVLKKSIPFSYLRTSLFLEDKQILLLASDYEIFALHIATKELKYVQRFSDKIMSIHQYSSHTLAIYLQGNQIQFFEFKM